MGGAFLEIDPVIAREFRKGLRLPTWPADAHKNRLGRFPKAKKQFLRVLGEESRSGLQILRLRELAATNGNGGADCISIAFRASKAERNGVAEIRDPVLQNA
ncbi:MAG: hypothetical protein NVS9B14_23800 [Candidatus Acidiferrum sp.]